MDMVYSLHEIRQAAARLLTIMGTSSVLAFEGDMGAGKTTFITALCRELEVIDTVSSPTFAIIHEYRTAQRSVYHIDLYRCNDEAEALRAGVGECIDSGHICLIEWPTRAPALLPPDTIRITLETIDPNTRRLLVYGSE